MPPSPNNLPDATEIVKDPEFHKLPIGEAHKVLMAADPDYAALPDKERATALKGIYYGPDKTPPKEGFGAALWNDIKGIPKGIGEMLAAPITSQGEGPGRGIPETTPPGVQQWQDETKARRSLPYKAGAAVAGTLGTNVPGMEQAAEAGDTGGVLGHATAGAIQAASPLIAEGAGEVAGKAPEAVARGLQKITGTDPARIAELSQVKGKVADLHSKVLATEASAKANAKAAFPDVKTPVELPSDYTQGGWQNGKFVTQQDLQPKQIPFKDAQEMYSKLSQDARDAHLARMRGNTTGFTEEDILAKKAKVDGAMRKAADVDGKLPEFLSARDGFKQFMNDFHNKGSAVEPLLEMKPDETSRIVSHLQNADKGARAVETLQKYGGDVQGIQDMLKEGSTPAKIDVNEAAKLRKVGPDQYKAQRLQESIDQARFNRLPSQAEARLPKWATSRHTIAGIDLPTRLIMSKMLQSVFGEESVTGKISPRRVAMARGVGKQP